MANIQRSGNLIEIDGRFRIESGPSLNTARATDALLSNEVTASHYHVGGRDATGAEINLGSEFTYLDWLGHREGAAGSTTWYIYQLDGEVWVNVEAAHDEDAAMSWVLGTLSKEA